MDSSTRSRRVRDVLSRLHRLEKHNLGLQKTKAERELVHELSMLTVKVGGVLLSIIAAIKLL